MTLSKLIEEVFQKGVDLGVSDGELYYHDPKKGLTSELKTRLDQYKTTILSHLNRYNGKSMSFSPLSSAQKTLWFLYQVAPKSAAYNVKFGACILSEIDIEAFQRACQALIDRHPSLRTTYITLDEGPVQIVHEHQQVPFEVIDASAWGQEDLHKRMYDEAGRSFDLERGPILRAYLFSRSPQECILWLLIHHIAVDFNSLETLIEELGVLYVSEKFGVLASLPPLKSRYVDYIRWEAQMLASSEGKRHWTYLQKQLTGELPVLNLPTDRPRPSVQTYQTASLFSTLSTELIQQIKAIAQTESTSLYATLVAAFFVLLYRYTGQENILLGASTEQGHTKFKGVTGYFVNQIPLCADLSENPIFREFLRKINQMIQAMFEHQDYPSHLLTKQLHLSRDPSHPPLFQAIFMLQELHQRRDLSPFLLGQGGGQIKLDGLVMESMSLEEQMMIFVDLQLTIIEGYESLSALWQYNTDLFDATTIERMTGHFRTLLEGIVANPDQRISVISILTEAERYQLLVEWNDTNVDYPKDRCIHEVFEAQVEQTPNAVAVVFSSVDSGHGGENQITYRELNVCANQLAHYLQALKVGPDVVVGLCIERSLEMVVGLLGILKAGGAYVPLDPAYPQDRLLFMLENSQVPVLVTQDTLVTGLPDHEAHVICLDTDWRLISQERGDNLVSGVTPENLAYIIYTSGSTGMPKGVAMKHLALLNLILWHLEDAALSRSAKTLQFSPVSFDVSFQEMFSTWCTGGTLALISEDLRRDPVALLHFLRDNSVERLFLPFVALQQLCEVAEDSKLFPESLREVITAGEQLQITAPVDKFFRTLKNCTLHNHYGPTESHVVTALPLPQNIDSWLALPPIGYPIANTQIYLLDRSFQPVPIGVPGELYIGGDCLARGYLNRPDLTDERFIPNPLRDDPKVCPDPSRRARLYKTGDLARYLPDGNIEFLGRLDHQLKIRGFRVEVGEIETLLSSYGEVREAVVIAHEDTHHNKYLAAYIVPNIIPDRIPFQSDCLVELDQNKVKLRTEDISYDGVSLMEIPTTFSEGKYIRLRLLLPGESQEHWFKGEITWRQGDRAGIQFTLSPTERTRVHQSVEYFFETQGFAKLLRRTASTSLRNYLKQKLPDYMVPSSLVFLDSLPLTPSGKVNRRALLAPERTRPEEEGFIAPRSSTEKALADIWSELLGLEHVGIRDNFFESGGDSLIVTRLASRLRDTFQVELSISKLFETSTIADLAAVIEKNLIKTETQTIPQRAATSPIPLSFAQQRIWFLEQLEAGTPIYNLPFSIRLTGPLDISILERSINEIVRRHEALRTTFALVGGQPVTVIAQTLNVTLTVKDLRELPENERKIDAQRVARSEAQQSFDLTQQDPLFRIMLLRLDEEEYVFLITFHHTIFDGWSIDLFLQELATLYEVFSTGKPLPLPDLPIQYSDFAQWQREWLQGEVLERQLLYWKQQLSGSLPVLELPTDHPRPAKRTFRGKIQSFVLSKRLSNAIRTLSRQKRSTTFMTLLAVFKTFFYRYTGQEDIIVGSPVANRNRTEIEKLIGFFVNTLVLRTDLSGNPTFSELLGRVRTMTLGAHAHQDMPFDRLVEELHPERELNRQPIFQVMFAFQDAPMQTLMLSKMTLEPMEIHTGAAMFDLTLDMLDTEQGLTGFFEYNTDLFDAATIARMVEHFKILLEEIVTDPERRLSKFPILTEVERHQILVGWNDTEADYPKDTCIHELFEDQVERTPDAVAVVFEEEQMTYLELNRRANQLAYYLRKLSVGPEVLVGICMKRTLEMLVGILGILKSGAAYVPVEPANPKKRLAFMLEDTCAPVLVTQQHLRKNFPDHKAHTICLDSDWSHIAAENDENPCSDVTTENLAYVIYTSGSTGIPKGVLISHQALVNRCTTMAKYYELEPSDHVLQFASISFDVSLEEIFPSLLSGATIILSPDQVSTSLEAFSALLEKEKLSILNLPTTYWHEWVSELSRSNIQLPSTLRLVIVGTEQASAERLAIWQTLVNDHVRWINAYGPTEATITTTIYDGSDMHKEDQNAKSVPIGCPINNTQVYLLDKYLQPVPIGVSGELHINSISLARGYLNRPELTVEKFIPNPFSDKPGACPEPGRRARLYKTGDLARYLPDGNIEFLGRLDDQVKVRGFRIELGEIETVLNGHPAVCEAVVVDREDISGNKRLAAYVVFHHEQKITVNELCDFIKTQLPEYMVPATFTFLDALPLTPSKKVNRHALPEPDMTRIELAETFVTPRTITEEILARIWIEVLGLEQVGVNANFFELGGHSLLAMQLVSKVANAMNLDISVKLLFLHPTIARLAVALGKLPQRSESAKPVPFKATCAVDLTVPFQEDLRQQASSLFKLEDRPLLSTAPFDAVALDYFLTSVPEQTGVSRNVIIHDWCNNLPVLYNVTETNWGRIGILMLPLFDSDLYSNKEDVISSIVEALEISEQIGARVVSLTGLLPSATNYGRDVVKTIAGREDLPMVSTGHATTCATVVLTIRKILQEGGRDLTQERVGFIGLGSIGVSTLRLMLRCLPHPMDIILCDVYNKVDFLEKTRQEVINDLGFRGNVRIALAQIEVSPEIYDATLIIGATNVADILDVRKVKPGTMIVDDSGPHCFVPKLAIRRFQEQQDMLFTEGGVLQSPHPITDRIYLPPNMKKDVGPAQLMHWFSLKGSPFDVTSCVLSGLLSSRFEGLHPTIGEIDGKAAFQHYELLDLLEFRGANLHCEDYVLPEESIRNFRNSFGKS